MSGPDRTAIPARCGCVVEIHETAHLAEIRPCPLHASTTEMLAALREAEAAIEAYRSDGYDPTNREERYRVTDALESVRYVIARVEAGRPFRDWLAYKAPEALGAFGPAARLLRTDPAGRRVLLDAEGLFAPQWVAVPDGIPVPALPREDHRPEVRS